MKIRSADNIKLILDLSEDALADANHPDSKPSEYYEELFTILGIFETMESEANEEELKRISELKSKINEKIKLKAFW